MDTDLPSLGMLILVELGVVAITAMATWQYARYHFRRRRSPPAIAPADDQRLESLETALDSVVRQVEQLGESQDFVQELLAERLTRMGLRPHAELPRQDRIPLRTPV